MTRIRKASLWIAAVMLVVGGLWFYNVYFKTTATALQFAETFNFRRMTVAQLDDKAGYRFFFATNRALAEGDEPLVDRFGSERTNDLLFGAYDTRIEPTLGLGMLINPSEWLQNEEIRLDDVRLVEADEFTTRLSNKVNESPYRGLLVIVHGFREGYESALRKTAFLGHVLDINSPVLVFDWPGNQGSSLRGYRRARDVAEASGAELAELLKTIVTDIDPDNLWLVANSMGAQVVADAFSILYADPALADAEVEFEDVVMTAPDVDYAELNNRFKQEISALAQNFTVYVSANDRALVVSRIVNGARRAGESTVDTLNPDQFEEAVRIAELVDTDDDLITLIDVTPINRTRNFHSFSLETPEFFDDLFLRLTNEQTPVSRQLYQIRTPEGKVYWVLTRAR